MSNLRDGNNDNHSSGAGRTPGQRLDEVLEPFMTDRARLREQLREFKNKRAELENQIKDTQRDLAVIEQAMIEAVREAARNEPLLAAAFNLKAEAPATASVSASKLPDLNPLLKPAER